MHESRSGRPTIGVLAGWQVYAGTIPLRFLELVLSGIRAAARERGCNLLLACGVGNAVGPVSPAWPVHSPGADFVPVGPRNTDGLVIVTPLMAQDRSRYVQDIIGSGHPVVFVGEEEEGPAIDVDNELGVRRAIAHLVDHGHRSIAFIARYEEDARGDGGSARRLETYYAAVQEHGLKSDPRLVNYGLHNRDGGRWAMHLILETGVEFTAVLASNDTSARGAMEELRQAGLRVPEDIAVVGFDDLPEAIVETPPLTSVHFPSFEMGYRALELLLDIIHGESETEIERIPPRLVIRRSCGCRASAGRQAKRVGGDAMVEAVLAGTHHANPGEVHVLCRQLSETFAASLAQGDTRPFHAALEQALRHMEAAGDDPHAWQAAVSFLRDGLPADLEGSARGLANDTLYLALAAVGESAQRQHVRRLVQQSDMADQLGWMTAELVAAMDDAQVFEALAGHLPGVGIRHAHVAFFEPEAGDSVARTALQTIPGTAQGIIRFPSHQFPPAGLEPDDEPFQLALLPLTIQDQASGYVAFETDGLEPCAAVVRQLASALKSARLYRDAVEGQQMAEEGQQMAEEANRLKSRFLSAISHELRTPLNLIVGLSRMLIMERARQEPASVEQVWQDVERIHTSARHLDSLIRDVLDLARSDVGRLKLVCEPLELGEALQVVVEAGEQMARDKGLGWHADIPAGLPRVWADRTRVRQVALNLVNNAFKFTTQGEVTMKCRAWNAECGVGSAHRESPVANAPPSSTDDATRDVRQATGDARFLAISVCDTGLGIPPKEQEIIFDEFRQGDRTATRGYGGLGLGLAICKRLVEMHGGRIWVESSGKEGGGSTFTFTLPATREVRPEPAPGDDEGKVLLVTREEGSHRHVSQHLAQRGFQVEEFRADEDKGWTSQLLDNPPGAIVLDLELTAEQGWEILKALKGNPATQNVPVLLCSLAPGRGGGSVLELDYVTKPVGPAVLKQALERYGLKDDERTNILVVDDEPGVLELHVRLIEGQLPTCRVLEARNGREALDIMRKEPPDLVLLDLMMPELDGFGVIEAMREEEATRDVPVIVLTAQVLVEEDMARLNRGVAAVLGKGMYSREETLAHIEAALARRYKLGSEPQRVVRRAMGYVHEHYAEPLSRDTIARHVGVSDGHLSRCFRQEMGITPITYLNRYRVTRAKPLLAAGGKSITEIALAVGFSNGNYFGRLFRRETGVSPGAYRRAHGGDR